MLISSYIYFFVNNKTHIYLIRVRTDSRGFRTVWSNWTSLQNRPAEMEIDFTGPFTPLGKKDWEHGKRQNDNAREIFCTFTNSQCFKGDRFNFDLGVLRLVNDEILWTCQQWHDETDHPQYSGESWEMLKEM